MEGYILSRRRIEVLTVLSVLPAVGNTWPTGHKWLQAHNLVATRGFYNYIESGYQGLFSIYLVATNTFFGKNLTKIFMNIYNTFNGFLYFQ